MASERIPELDGLRGVAILLVLMFHLMPSNIPLWAAWIVQSGWLGVDLFFVLSGFLITGLLLDSAGSPGYYRNFVARRALRIFPLYYVCLAIAAVIDHGPWPIHWADFAADGGWFYPFFLGNIPVTLRNKWPSGTLTPLWSLQIEEQFYLTFPFLVAVLGRKTLARVLMASVVIAPLLRIALVYARPANISGTYVLMPCRMDALALGGLVAIAGRQYPEALRSRWIGLVTGIAAAGLVWLIRNNGPLPWSNPMRTIGFSAAAVAFTGVLVLLMMQRQRLLLALFRFRPLVWTGGISYGLYLLHAPANELVQKHAARLGIASDGASESLLALTASFAAAWISAKFFERPILHLRDRIMARR